jgi:hypothetical protein
MLCVESINLDYVCLHQIIIIVSYCYMKLWVENSLIIYKKKRLLYYSDGKKNLSEKVLR